MSEIIDIFKITIGSFHDSKELDLTKHDVSKTWGVLRQIIGLTGPKVSKNLKFDYNNKIISDDTEIANSFNNFFAY